MSEKIAIGVLNTHNLDINNKCIKSLPSVDYIFNIHNIAENNIPKNYNRYISYGGLNNILIRDFLKTDAEYFFIIKSNIILVDNSIVYDFINTSKAFGIHLLTAGSRQDKFIEIEDDQTNKSVCLYENLNNNFIFLKRSLIKECGFFNEGFINVKKTAENVLEIYDYYYKVLNKFNYLPLGYFPDCNQTILKINIENINENRPNLKDFNNNILSKIHGKFYYYNKFIIGKHKTSTIEDAHTALELLQNKFSIKI